jgi:ABC-type uncharacterized transport system involved in gliding motility auxiliary subunit
MRREPILLAVQTALVTAILACVVLIAHRHPWRLDLTPGKRFTLSPHSKDVLARLDTDVGITAFYSSQDVGMREDLGELLSLYDDASPRVSTRLVDLDRSPGVAQQLGVRTYNTAVVTAGGRRERVDLVVEELLTSAILRTAGMPPVAAYLVTGHGECNPGDDEARGGFGMAVKALEADGFDVHAGSGAAQPPPPGALVVLAGPTRDLAAAEVDALERFARAGGSLLVLVDPPTPRSLVTLLGRFGVEPGDDIVVDEQGRLLGTDGLAARIAFLNQQLVPQAPEATAILPIAQSLRLVDAAGVQAEYLGGTAETTWADVDRRALSGGAVQFRPDRDRHGPLPVAALVRIPAGDDREGRIVVVGDADFATNLHLGVLGNRDLLLVIAELAVRPNAYTASRPPPVSLSTFSTLALTAREASIVLWSAAFVPAILAGAMALAMARRRQRA